MEERPILRAVMTRGRARANGVARLRASGDVSAALAADVLLADACRISKETLYAHLDVELAEDELARYRELIERRSAGEPVAYLRGWKEFFGLRFAVDRRVLIPRPETETLVEAALAFLRATGRTRVADVGTGSGAVAVAIAASLPAVRVIATDLSTGALEVARANIRANAVEGRVEARSGDLLDPVEEEVDVVTANLPYLSEKEWRARVRLRRPEGASTSGVEARGRRPTRDEQERTSLLFEPREAVLAGGEDGLDVIRRAVAQLPAKLAPGGAAFFECDPPQAPAVAGLLQTGLGATTCIIADLMGNERVVEGRRPG